MAKGRKNIRNTVAKKGGRETKFKASFYKQVEKLCLLGATDKELADFLEIAQSTLNEWKKNDAKFMESIKKGKEQADSEVASKLYKRAMGYRYKETTEEDGKTIKTVTKEVPPDTIAQMYWLKNRQPKKWRDKQDIVHGGEVAMKGIRFVVGEPDD